MPATTETRPALLVGPSDRHGSRPRAASSRDAAGAEVGGVADGAAGGDLEVATWAPIIGTPASGRAIVRAKSERIGWGFWTRRRSRRRGRCTTEPGDLNQPTGIAKSEEIRQRYYSSEVSEHAVTGALAGALGVQYARIQVRPDLMPTDPTRALATPTHRRRANAERIDRKSYFRISDHGGNPIPSTV